MGTSRRPAGKLSRYELDGVSLRFQSRGRGAERMETLALDDVSLAVGAGELAVIMGPSGSGKSTLLHVLAGLAKPDQGVVTFCYASGEDDAQAARPQRRQGNDGELEIDLARSTEDERARIRGRHIGFVYQAFNLIPTMTAADNVALPLLFRGVAARDRNARAEAMIRQVGLPKHASRFPSELSGGEQQRVAIARALVFNPVVLLADEPTGSLDSKASGEVLDVFAQLHEDRGLTVVLVTHDPAVAKRLDGHVIQMRDGAIRNEAAR